MGVWTPSFALFSTAESGCPPRSRDLRKFRTSASDTAVPCESFRAPLVRRDFASRHAEKRSSNRGNAIARGVRSFRAIVSRHHFAQSFLRFPRASELRLDDPHSGAQECSR